MLDDFLDIGIGYHRGNSNNGDHKIRIYDGNGNILKEFTKSDNADGQIAPLYYSDGKLFSASSAGYALSPRGITCWNYATGTENWHYNIGPSVYWRNMSIADINNDSVYEISLANTTVHNGASANGTTDGDCYNIIIDENGNNFLTQIYQGTTSKDGYLRCFGKFYRYRLLSNCFF